MRVINKETCEICELEYIDESGIDVAPDIMGNWGFKVDFYNEYNTPVMHDYEIQWWADIFKRLERIDEAGVDWEIHVFKCPYDLYELVKEMEGHIVRTEVPDNAC